MKKKVLLFFTIFILSLEAYCQSNDLVKDFVSHVANSEITVSSAKISLDKIDWRFYIPLSHIKNNFNYKEIKRIEDLIIKDTCHFYLMGFYIDKPCIYYSVYKVPHGFINSYGLRKKYEIKRCIKNKSAEKYYKKLKFIFKKSDGNQIYKLIYNHIEIYFFVKDNKVYSVRFYSMRMGTSIKIITTKKQTIKKFAKELSGNCFIVNN